MLMPVALRDRGETMERQQWLGLMAKANPEQIDACWQNLGLSPEYAELRPPEIGGVMVRGRMGGTGDAFNLGEMTVTRCSVQLRCGTVGHGYVQGRAKQAARHVALCDALLQTEQAPVVAAKVLDVLAADREKGVNDLAGKAAATKVDFFTLARGDN